MFQICKFWCHQDDDLPIIPNLEFFRFLSTALWELSMGIALISSLRTLEASIIFLKLLICQYESADHLVVFFNPYMKQHRVIGIERLV